VTAIAIVLADLRLTWARISMAWLSPHPLMHTATSLTLNRGNYHPSMTTENGRVWTGLSYITAVAVRQSDIYQQMTD